MVKIEEFIFQKFRFLLLHKSAFKAASIKD
jgi:hypothetical protein